ncbi:class I SAM-dependent methyltransferase [Streptomyces chattanoogensis]|uniref:class I SAM-dependent methyltransferase n=1 Tax=Streptomyces chattanoogensis TaxID=66876 RepID=UPI00368AEA87
MTTPTLPSAADWDRQHAAVRSRPLRDHETLRFYQHVQPSSGMVAADIGCGSGQWTRQLARWGVRVVGYDFSSVALEKARADRQMPGISYVEWDANAGTAPPELGPGSLDLVTCRMSLAYIDTGHLLPLIGQWLTTRGVLYIDTPVEYPNRPHPLFHRGLTDEEIRDLASGWAYARTIRVGRCDRAIVLRGYGA